MWCPEGYLRWDEFRGACRTASRRFLLRRYGAVKVHTLGAPVDHSAEGPFARKDKEVAVANWLMAVALEDGIFSCASASGHPVRLETKQFAPRVFKNDIAVAEIFCSDTLPWCPTDWDDAPPAWWKVWMGPRYLFIRDETGVILNPSEAALQNFADKFADQYCYECHGEVDTPSTRDNLKGLLHFELTGARALASQFEGQVLCIRADVADQFTASAFDEFVGNTVSQVEVSAKQRPGRPRKQELALAALRELYPEGHKPSAKEGIAAIKRLTGVLISKDTYRRMLKK